MTAAPAGDGERVAKLIARAGLCSRRDAERWIAARRVAVDGRVLDSPAVNVAPGQRVTVDGKTLPAAEPARLFRYHKPRGVVTTARDPEGRTTVADTLPAGLPRLMPVGRLDLSSEGLLLLTNDGALKRRLELPATGWLRRYRARVFGHPPEPQLRALAGGVTVAGVAYGPIDARLDRLQGDNAWLTVALREGRNREVRRVLEHLGYRVGRLIRVAYGPFQLGALPERGVDEVRPKVLKEQLGRLLPAAGCRRLAPPPGRLSTALRIVAGRHRGRLLRAPPGRATRPTSDRAREALLTMLEHGAPSLRGSRFLDLFAGTGAVGLEALSRGAAAALLVETAPAALAAIRANLAALGEAGRAQPLAADATRLGPAPHAFELAFLDPPYRSALAAPALERLVAGGWLAPDARVVCEVAAGEALTPPPGLEREGERRHGAARLVCLRYRGAR